MNISLRRARREDAGLILKFIGELAEFEKLAKEVTASVTDLEQTLFAEQPRAEVLIAEGDGEPAGFALYFYTYSTFLGRPGLYLEDLFVSPAFRGKKIGRALLSALAQICAENQLGRLEWSVLDWNQDAIRFYENLGAKAQSEWTRFRLSGESLKKLAQET